MKTIRTYPIALLLGAVGLSAGVPALTGRAAYALAAPASAPLAEARAAWQEIEQNAAALDRVIKAGRLAEVHEIAFAIRDRVVTLPYKSSGLGAAARKKLDRQVKTIADIAALLDKHGDANNAKGVKLQQVRLKQALAAIKGLYPPGALTGAGAAVRASAAERDLFLTPGGAYTAADIKANGGLTVSQKYPDFVAEHDAKPRPGERVCPITDTVANPKLTWVVGGKIYSFCCPPCVSEFVRKAKKDPGAIKAPGAYVKK